MQTRTFLSLVVFLAIFVGQVESGCGEDVVLTNLPSIVGGHYKVQPYIRAAIQLQEMGQAAAVEQLLSLAKTAAISAAISDAIADEQRTAILCRMLFVARRGSTFARASYLGGASFYGEDYSVETTSYTNWPSEPIELEGGIPFAIVHGYEYEGIWDPHGAESYVHYCATNCVWSSFRFTPKSADQKREALRRLIESRKWRRPLESWEWRDLTEQIQ
jgi:hypothetical protein